MPNPERLYTNSELEKLQTLPVGYTRVSSSNTARKLLGNGWTAEVVIHILSYINAPLNEPIIVLSMYDGIATGYYCLKKLGYKNITYYAYEINQDAIAVAKSNYSDIIHCGDAFEVRKDDWCIENLKKIS